MEINERISAFVKLGKQLRLLSQEIEHQQGRGYILSQKALAQNGWFTPESSRYALWQIAESLQPELLHQWAGKYHWPADEHEQATIAVIMAGNIPLVGFHDFLSVLIAGHRFLGKLSSKDQVWFRVVAEELIKIEPRFATSIRFVEERITDYQAVIATGSNNSTRYFDYYFGRYPHIFRQNRNSLAVISGNETPGQMKQLGEDIFRYFGLGCRNISNLFLPRGYCFEHLFDNMESFRSVGQHHKYANNYDYHRSLFLMNGIQHYDNGFVMLKEDSSLSSPVSVVHFQYYDNMEQVHAFIQAHQSQLQCVVGPETQWLNPGEAQQPALWDYADNIDTLEFLLHLQTAHVE